jgi:hypothetical protein
MLLVHINGHDRGAQIYSENIFLDPPDHSSFNGGGSGIADKTCAHLNDLGSSMQIYDQRWILDPTVCSAFNGKWEVRNK